MVELLRSGVCQKCGAALAAGADVRGTCPRCMLQWAFADHPDDTAVRPTPKPVAAVEEPELRGRFGNFLIERLIGRGGMGVVYLAQHSSLGRRVALKVLPEALSRDEQFTERFQREARALGSLSHPNIVGVHECGCIDGRFFFAMEFVEGGSLRNLLDHKALSPERALQIVPQLCDALQYAHAQGVVHRDIKPENILVDPNGVVKVADFGLAKIVGNEPAGYRALTRSDLVVGTLHYMAPEQVEKPKEVDHRADIYSLGVVFYEMLTGELPLGRFEPPSHHSNASARLDHVVMRALEKRPERRYQSASELKVDAQRSAHGAPPLAAPFPPGPGAPARSSRWALWLGVAAALLIFVPIPVLGLLNAGPGGSSIGFMLAWGMGATWLIGLIGSMIALGRGKIALGCAGLALCAFGFVFGSLFLFVASPARVHRTGVPPVPAMGEATWEVSSSGPSVAEAVDQARQAGQAGREAALRTKLSLLTLTKGATHPETVAARMELERVLEESAKAKASGSGAVLEPSPVEPPAEVEKGR